ncbi:hypothetical protein [Sutcliffiella horikoshii]|uniref:Uncharacterized protein n=1 Tax=Sutcliffiella horikoshii TaxID=79883 RepID=A0A5D4T340_9BACI|nr:hypothetical protein [Sutcliffiella horikoshii]TYS70023.1 hypothetical protein FZC75_15400 [Sutcliffiella horikoshii]
MENEEEVVEDAPPVEEEEPDEEVQEEVEEETEEAEEEAPAEEPVAELVDWQGKWIISAEPFNFGNLSIYDETDEGFYFDIRVNKADKKELKNIYAKKDGSVATSEATETGCVLTLTQENERIQVKESNECADNTLSVDFNNAFILPDTYVFEENFVASIKEGKLSTDGYALGDDIDVIEQELGEPEAYVSPSGALFRIYSDIGYGTDAVGSNGKVGSLIVLRPEEHTPDYMKELLGEPEGEGISELDGFYYLYYTIGDKYKLYIDFLPEEKTMYRLTLGIL